MFLRIFTTFMQSLSLQNILHRSLAAVQLIATALLAHRANILFMMCSVALVIVTDAAMTTIASEQRSAAAIVTVAGSAHAQKHTP